jgi:hypothetical protein
VTSRPTFLKVWLVLLAASVALGGAGVAYGGRLHGSALVVISVILAVFLAATFYASKIAWDSEAAIKADGGVFTGYCDILMMRARWVYFAVWVCQIIGIMGTVFGFWVLLSDADTAATLQARIEEAGGVALGGTFVGVFCSLVLAIQHRILESRLA